MFLRHKVRRKDGNGDRYWSIVENRRVAAGRTVRGFCWLLGKGHPTTTRERHGARRSKSLTRAVDRAERMADIYPRIARRGAAQPPAQILRGVSWLR